MLGRNKRKKQFTTDAKDFFANVGLSRKNHKLPESTIPDFRLHAIRVRAEHAKELLESDFFQETIQYMNEEVVQNIAKADTLDTDRLGVLQLELKVISDFQFKLAFFMEEYEAALVEEQQARQREQDQQADDEYEDALRDHG